MKNSTLFVTAMTSMIVSLAFTSMSVFAEPAYHVNSLSAAWKGQHPTHLHTNTNNITMGYGGEDMASSRPSLVERTTTA